MITCFGRRSGRVSRELFSIFLFTPYFLFGFDGGIKDLNGLVHDHYLPFFFTYEDQPSRSKANMENDFC